MRAALARWMLAIAIAFLGTASVASGPKEEFDVIVLKNGSCLTGLILEETPTAVRFQYVRRKPGRLTTLFTTSFPRADIVRVLPLPAPQRDALRDQLKQIEIAPEIERARIDHAELIRIDWEGKPNAGLRYDSDYFVLHSDAQEALVRRVAVRLEQICTAYTRFLPPRFPGGRPTTIVLVKTLDGYKKQVERHGGKFENPAFYVPAANLIVCGSNLAQLDADLEEVRRKHREQWAECAADEAALRKLYANDKKRLAQLLEPYADVKARLTQADRYNDGLVNQATEQLFAILYHEAFHAYAANFVYPAGGGELPRWLNEGLAQIFESALIEAGELRVGHADRKRLFCFREMFKKNEALSVAALLKVGRPEFIVGHDGRKDAGRVYLTAWGLAFYLTFDRRLLGTPAMDDYVRAVNAGADPLKAFEVLVGQPIERFERDFRGFIDQLQPDGTLAELKGKN